ncbi:MAG: DUF4124 domain-containing protein [Gammaproteobacteria bacterium]
MSNRPTILALAALFLGLSQASAQTLYRWVDENGQVHYGDHVPPAYSTQDHEVLNDHGVSIRSIDGAATDEELAEQDRIAAEQESARLAEIRRASRDRVLLDTYLSVDEIIRLRDQRLDLLQAQISVTETYLVNLSDRLMELRQNAKRFKPYSPDPDAPAIPDNLALDMTQTADSITLYEATLARTRDQAQTLSDAFARDIERFKELTGS